MYLVTAKQMKAMDTKATEVFHIPEIVLMENAGRAVTEFILRKFTNIHKMNITIAVGNGNNGGDGLVVARCLHKLGIPVKVFLLMEKELTPSAQINLDILEMLPVKIYRLESENSLHLFKVTVNYTDLFIDAILGTGITRNVSPRIAQVIDIVNKRSCKKLAIDVPTGLNCDTGDIWGSCFKVHYTAALALPKRGFFLNKGIKYCGEVTVLDIGIPDEVFLEEPLNCQVIDDDYLQKRLGRRERSSHKGSYGHLLIIGGSMGMGGAITLAASGAFRSGIGVVTCAVPSSIQLQVAVSVPEAMVRPLPDAQQMTVDSVEALQKLTEDKKAVLIGPGMGCEEAQRAVLQEVLQHSRCPVVVDADGLTLLENHLDLLENINGSVILTPHPGEMARLTGFEVSYIQANRIEVAQDFAMKYQVWLVLKGANTVIATPKGMIYLNTIDSPALAIAGSGDVLAGLVGAFLAQGLQTDAACCCAVNLHGKAGVRLSEQIGDISSKAGDLIDILPEILRGEGT